MKSLKSSALVVVFSVLVLWTGNVFAQGNDPLVDEVAILGSGSSNPQSSSELQASSNSEWKDVTTTDGTTPSTCAETPANCTMKENWWRSSRKRSGLSWSKRLPGDKNWEGALAACAALAHNGQEAGTWRLPTVHELTAAAQHGIKDAASGYWISLANDNWFWSASTDRLSDLPAGIVFLGDGYTASDNKNSFWAVVCVQ